MNLDKWEAYDKISNNPRLLGITFTKKNFPLAIPSDKPVIFQFKLYLIHGGNIYYFYTVKRQLLCISMYHYLFSPIQAVIPVVVCSVGHGSGTVGLPVGRCQDGRCILRIFLHKQKWKLHSCANFSVCFKIYATKIRTNMSFFSLFFGGGDKENPCNAREKWCFLPPSQDQNSMWSEGKIGIRQVE